MSNGAETRVPCSKATREKLWNAKRGGESFDELFNKMLKQYDPDAAYEPEDAKTAT